MSVSNMFQKNAIFSFNMRYLSIPLLTCVTLPKYTYNNIINIFFLIFYTIGNIKQD
jgi:hypothetical protein